MFNKKTSLGENFKWGIAGGFAQCLYVLLVVLVFNLIEIKSASMDSVLTGGLFMLLFFIVSILISGVLVLGKPILLVLDKKITQALNVFFISLLTIFVVFLIVGLIIFI